MGSVDGESLIIRGYPEITLFNLSQSHPQIKSTPDQFGCDECFHCYTSKFYADLHELEQHPDTFYVRDHIPSSTKEHFARLQHQRFR